MGPKDLQLVDGTIFRTAQISPKITKILWVMDPARVRRIDPGILVQLEALNRTHDLRTAKLKAELKQADLDLYEGVKQLVG
jgi:hypothetical protein